MNNIDLEQIITPEAAKAASKDRLLRLLAEIRWCKENEGVNITEKARFQSDRTTRAELTSLLSNLELGTIDGPVTWKALSGWEVVGMDQLRQILWLLNAHVQACFATERSVADLVSSGEVSTAKALRAAFARQFDSLAG